MVSYPVKIPEFDPAIARVLEAAGRIMVAPDAAADAETVRRRLGADDDPLALELANDIHRVKDALEQLRSDGLLEAVVGGSGYRLTVLGRARVTRPPEED
jgi:ApbE superfamily uncharacterized protein (UPF0280 family)